MVQKNVQKTTFDLTSEMIRLYPIRTQEYNRKTFEGAGTNNAGVGVHVKIFMLGPYAITKLQIFGHSCFNII